MKAAYRSDIGRVRGNNEDSVLVDRDLGVFIIADGMGGHQAGEVASSLAVEVSYGFLREGIGRTTDENDVRRLLNDAVIHAHEVVREKSLAGPEFRGMGTTIVAMAITGNHAYICHVGDSRAYLMRDDLRQITRDHTTEVYPGIMGGRGVRMLAQAVGTLEDVFPGINAVELAKGDIVLLCSDGLTDMLDDNEIEEIIGNNVEDMNKAADALVEAANKRGGRDNITVVMVKS